MAVILKLILKPVGLQEEKLNNNFPKCNYRKRQVNDYFQITFFWTVQHFVM